MEESDLARPVNLMPFTGTKMYAVCPECSAVNIVDTNDLSTSSNVVHTKRCVNCKIWLKILTDNLKKDDGQGSTP